WLVLRPRFVVDSLRCQRLWRFSTYPRSDRISAAPPKSRGPDHSRMVPNRCPCRLEKSPLHACVIGRHASLADGRERLSSDQRRHCVSKKALGCPAKSLAVRVLAGLGRRWHLRKHSRIG